MIPIKDNYKIRYGPDYGRPDKENKKFRIYKTKKSILDRPSGPVALSLYGSRRALSEDSGFKSYPSRPEVYLVKKRGAISNSYGRQQLLGIQLQDSAFLSEVAVNHLKKARGESLAET